MGFLAPWFLGGLAALSVPIFVHLLQKHVTIPRPVSSLMFFERGTQSSTRHRRLRYLLLFALRFALLLLVVLAFADPFIRRPAADANGRLLLIVLDNSFSMRAGTRFADAKQQALAVLTALTALTACGTAASGHTGPGGQPMGMGQQGAAEANPDLDPGTSLGGAAAPDFRLTNQFGQQVSLSAFRGKVVILAFTDSECTTVCPLTTMSMVEAKQLLGRAGQNVQLLGIDANPDATAVSDVMNRSTHVITAAVADWLAIVL